MRQLGYALVVVVCCVAVALAGPKKKAPKGGKADQKAQKANWPKQPDPALQAEISEVQAAYSAAISKQQHPLAVKLAKKLYDLQIKGYGADSVMGEIAVQSLAGAYLGAGDYVNAEKMYLAYVKAAEKRHGRDSQEVYYALLGYKGVFSSQLRWDDAEKVDYRMLAIMEKLHGKKSKEYAEQLATIGSGNFARGNYSASVQNHLDALQILESVIPNKDDPAILSQVDTVGTMLWYSNQQQKAIPYFDRAVKIAESSKDLVFITRLVTIWVIGNTYAMGGRKDLGEPLLKKAIAMAKGEIARLEKDNPKDPMLSSLWSQLGGMYRNMDDLSNAEMAYKKSAEVSKRNGYGGGMDYVLGDIKRLQGKPKEALALMESAKAEMAKIAPTSAVAFNGLITEVLLDLKDYARAEKLEDEYRRYVIKQWGKKGAIYGSVQMVMGRVYAAAGKLKQAEAALDEALDILEKELARMMKLGTDADHAIYFAQHSHELEYALNFNFVFQPNSGSAARLALTTLLRRKGRLLDAAAAALANIRKNLSPEDQKVLDELASARAQLAKLTVAGPQGSGDPATYAKDVAALEDKISRLEGQISKKSAAYRVVSTPIELAAVQKAIPKDAKLVELVNYQPYDPRKTSYADIVLKKVKFVRHYAAYIVGHTGDPIAIDLGDAAPIDATVEKFRKALSDPDNDQAAAIGNDLYKLTMGKIVPKLGSKTNILVAPDGALNVVPFSALVDDKKQFLIAKYTFTYLTSGRDLLRVSLKPKAQGGGIMFADPQFDGVKASKAGGKTRGTRSADLASLHWPQLPGTAAEADAVSKAYKNMKVYRGEAATENTLKQIKSPRVLHLATHGFFLPDEPLPPSEDKGGSGMGGGGMAAMPGGAPSPQAQQYENPLLRSGLALAGANKLSSGDEDGLLTALEASGLDLEGTKLVVLSACETGVGKVTNGDGVYGLRRSLVIAGAESLVMSMWQVDDFATKELMTNLYKGLSEGKGRSAAMRDAQIKVLTNPKYGHPFYWAAFVAAGSTTPIKD